MSGDGFEGFNGQAYTPAGDKGRFSLPPKFRRAVMESSGSRILCIDKHDSWPCLVGFGRSRTVRLREQLQREFDSAERRGNDDFNYEERKQQLFGYEEVPFDDSGRFIMPSFLADLGQIDDGLFFRGSDDFFFIWNPERLYEMGPAWEKAKAACRSMVQDAGSRGKRK